MTRAAYPLAIRDDSLSTAAALCVKTLPILGLRLAVLLGFTLASGVWFFMTMGIAALIGRVAGGPVGFWTFLIGLGIPGGFYYWLRRYVLYSLKLAHMAVLTRLITHGDLEGKGSQLEYGRKVVTERFGEVSVLFAVDALVEGVVRAFNRSLNFVAGWLPVPGLKPLIGLAEKVLDNATTYVDEMIFSYNLASGEPNVWRSSRDGLVYYAQSWRAILKTAALGMALEYGLSAVAFLLLLGPALAWGWMLPGSGVFAILLAVMTVGSVRAAVLRPLFLTMVALTFHLSVNGQELDPDIESSLESISSKFGELAERASTWVDPRGAPSPAAVPAGPAAASPSPAAPPASPPAPPASPPPASSNFGRPRPLGG